jgi:hypothetical protein
LLASFFFGALGLKLDELGLPRGEAFADGDSGQSPLLNRIELMRQAALDAGDPFVELRDLFLQATAAQAPQQLGADVRDVLLRKNAFEHDLNHALLQLIRAHVMLIGTGSVALAPFAIALVIAPGLVAAALSPAIHPARHGRLTVAALHQPMEGVHIWSAILLSSTVS